MNNFPLETDVRIQVDERLKNLGWEFDGINKNVFLEQPKTDAEKKKLGGKRPDYVLYEKGKDTPLIVIETKKKGANINLAIEQGKFYAETLNVPIVFATDGVYYKSLHTVTQKPLLLNGEEVDELIRELTAIQYLQTGSNALDTIPKQIQLSRQELISIFNEANNSLRVEGLRAGIERFGEFSNILFLKLFSEIDDLKEKQDFDRKWKWNFYKTKPADEILDYINKIVLPEISTHYNDSNILSPLQIKDGRVLKKIIDKLDPLVLTDINSDIKGDAFEYFLKSTTATGNDLGEYFTPRHIVKMMVKLANPQIGEKIYDPFCGTGGMLIESFRHIYNTMPRNERTLKQLKEDTVFGNEITNTARITKMNMILAGDGHSNIQMKNSLASPEENKYDVILTNMPYSQTTEYGSLYDVPTKNGDSICVQHCIKSIDKTSENGRIVMVVPEGFLFRKDLQKTREYMLKKCKLQSIISLPQGVFLPYTGVKTNVVYLTKVKQEETKNHFWYFDVKNDGYSLDNHRRKLSTENDIEIFLANRKIDENNKNEVLNVGFNFIELDKVKDNDYILSGNRYKNLFEYDNSKYDFITLNDCCDIINGSTPLKSKAEYWTNGTIHWFTVEDIKKQGREIFDTQQMITPQALSETSLRLIPINSILLCCTASVGEYAINKIPLTTNQQFNALVIKDYYKNKLLPKYLFYISYKFKETLEIIGGSTSFNYVSVKTLKNLKIPIPTIDKQENIIKELDSYQRIIDGARMVVENYKHSFEIKSEWEICGLSDISAFIRGITFPKSAQKTEKQSDCLGIVTTKAAQATGIVENDVVFIDKSYAKKEKYLREGDILISLANSLSLVGRTTYVDKHYENLSFGAFMGVIRADKTKILPQMLYYLLNSNVAKQYFLSNAKTTTNISNLTFEDLGKLTLSVPPFEIQQQIVAQIEAEQVLVESSKKLIEVFAKKMADKVNQIWGV